MVRYKPQYTKNTFTYTDDEVHIPNPYYITPAVHICFCSTFNLNPLFDLVHTTKSDSFESLDLASVGRCEDESIEFLNALAEQLPLTHRALARSTDPDTIKYSLQIIHYSLIRLRLWR